MWHNHDPTRELAFINSYSYIGDSRRDDGGSVIAHNHIPIGGDIGPTNGNLVIFGG